MSPRVIGVRHLTEGLKAAILKGWEQRKVETAGRPWESGFPDPDVFLLCDQINAMPGICTVQSCAGHRKPCPDGESAWASEAHVWVRLDVRIEPAFDYAAFDLAGQPNIYGVGKRYCPTDGAVATVDFAGLDVAGTDEHRQAALQDSMERVARFFAFVSERCLDE